MEHKTNTAANRERECMVKDATIGCSSPQNDRMFSNLDALDIPSNSKKSSSLTSLTESSYSGLSEESLPLLAVPDDCLFINEREDLRVLIYTPCYNIIDGVTLTIRKLEREILASGGQVCILSTNSGRSDNTNLVSCHPNRTVHFLDNSVDIFFMENAKDPELSYKLGFNLSRNQKEQIDAFKPTVIHITALDITASHIISYARNMQIPLMGTYHSNIPDYFLFMPGLSWMKPVLERIFRHFYNFFQCIYVPTPFIQRNLIEQQKMDRATDVKIWARGVDLHSFSPSYRTQQFRLTHNIPDGCPIILYVGRLVPEKRIDIFVDVIKRLNAKNINFRAVVVGAGPADDLIQSIKNMIPLGWLDGDELREAYASSDIFLFPSSVETFGNVTLEAAASGLPLVVEANCSGHLVKDGVNGYACETGNVDSFYKATLALLLDENMRKTYSHESIVLSATFDESTIVRQMLQNYDDITKQFQENYDGLHQNRDKEYRNQDSFLLGMEPRPFGLQSTCYIFINGLWGIGMLLKFFTCCKVKYNVMMSNLICMRKQEDELIVHQSDKSGEGDKVDGNECKGRSLFVELAIKFLDSRFFLHVVKMFCTILQHFFWFMSCFQLMCTNIYTCRGRFLLFCAKKRGNGRLNRKVK